MFVGLGASFGPVFGGALYTVSNTTISGTTGVTCDHTLPPSLIFRRGEGGHDTFTCRIVC